MSQSEYKMSYIFKQVKNFELWAPHYSVALVVKNPPTNAGDVRDCGLDPWIWRIPCGRKWQPTPVSCLENSMDRGDWCTTVHGVAKSRTQLKQFSTLWKITFPNVLTL